jgi:hypothetical protein
VTILFILLNVALPFSFDIFLATHEPHLLYVNGGVRMIQLIISQTFLAKAISFILELILAPIGIIQGVIKVAVKAWLSQKSKSSEKLDDDDLDHETIEDIQRVSSWKYDTVVTQARRVMVMCMIFLYGGIMPGMYHNVYCTNIA